VGQAVPANFICSRDGHLRGQIQDGSGIPISNIELVVQPFPIQSSGGASSIYPVTDGNEISTSECGRACEHRLEMRRF